MNINGYEIKAFADLCNTNLCNTNLRGANLRNADLRGADLRGANLRGANLRGADLRGANLRGANLSDTDLRGANLRGANLRGAELLRANLSDTDLRGANLSDTDLRGADLRGAELLRANFIGAKNIPPLPWTIIVPEGDLIVYKKVFSSQNKIPLIIKLLIPKEAKRSNATTRKCRAEYAKVLECPEVCFSGNDPSFKYEQGKIVRPTKPFDENRWNDCAPGIHFFLTREEAEKY